MIDFVLGLTLAGLALRGWFRGFAREAMDLVGVSDPAIPNTPSPPREPR